VSTIWGFRVQRSGCKFGVPVWFAVLFSFCVPGSARSPAMASTRSNENSNANENAKANANENAEPEL